jgi:hypothetical protein
MALSVYNMVDCCLDEDAVFPTDIIDHVREPHLILMATGRSIHLDGELQPKLGRLDNALVELAIWRETEVGEEKQFDGRDLCSVIKYLRDLRKDLQEP